MIIAAIIATALMLVIAIIFALEIEAQREVIQPLIRSENNRDIIGDGAWIEKPQSALVSKMRKVEI